MRKIEMILTSCLIASGCTDPHAPASTRPVLNMASGGAPFIAFGLSASERHTCAIAPGSNIQCWGDNSSGQVGSGSAEAEVASPATVGSGHLVSVSVGGNHSCGLDAGGSAYCWGSNTFGQLGTGHTTPAALPVAVSTNLRFTNIGVGSAFSCALTHSGTVFCWGLNANKQLGSVTTQLCPAGLGSRACSTVPLPVDGPDFELLSIGLWNGCGIVAGGAAYCWGNNTYGQLGIGTPTPPKAEPQAVAGGHRFVQISVGGYHICGLTDTQGAYCWGNGQFGNLGNGGGNAFTPVPVVGGHSFVTINAGDGNVIFAHTCAINTNGDLYCWGANSAGQLGGPNSGQNCTFINFTRPCVKQPTAIASDLSFQTIELGNQYSCGISRQRRLYCWGSNLFSRLGSEVSDTTSTPTPVATWMKGRGDRFGASREAAPPIM